MSTLALRVTENGYQKGTAVGDVIIHEGKKAVIIKIYSLDWIVMENQVSTRLEVVAQLVDSPKITDKYFEENTITERYKYSDLSSYSSRKRIFKVGDSFCSKYEKDKTYSFEILEIISYKYDGVDLLVTYLIRIVQEWSKIEIDKAVRKNRINNSEFKVIG